MTDINTNSYFTPDIAETTEHDLVADMIAEAIEIMGITSYYLPFDKATTTIDAILDEEIVRVYTAGYKIPIYVSNWTDPTGANDMMTKFGIIYTDDNGFVYSRKHFKMINVDIRPEFPENGDLIYVPLLKTLYTITSVPHRHNFNQLGNQFVWNIRAVPYSPSMDSINTSINDINMLGDANISFAADVNNNQNTTGVNIGDLLTLNNNDPFGGF